MKSLLSIVVLYLLFLSTPASAYTECHRTVANIWNSLASNNHQVWITFSDGGGAIYKGESQLTSGQMNRFFSQVLTAQTAGKKLAVRYPEDNLSCPPPAAVNRNDILGVWVVN